MEGPLAQVVEQAGQSVVDPNDVVELAPGMVVREGIGLDVPGSKDFLPVAPFDSDVSEETRTAMVTNSCQSQQHLLHRLVRAGMVTAVSA